LLPGYWEVWHRFGDPKRFMMVGFIANQCAWTCFLDPLEFFDRRVYGIIFSGNRK
jgi:hypothetical protein